MSRPIKYKERMQNISIALEPSVIKWLEDEADKRHMSRNEYITFLLISHDQKKSDFLISEIKKLKEIKEEMRIYSQQINTFYNSHEHEQKASFFEDIKEFPEIDEILNQEKHKERLYYQFIQADNPEPLKYKIEGIVNSIFEDFKDLMITKGKIIKQNKSVKSQIKAYITKRIYDKLRSDKIYSLLPHEIKKQLGEVKNTNLKKSAFTI